MKRYLLLGVLTVTVLTASVAYASGPFSAAAERWYINNCPDVFPKSTTGINAAVCSLRDRVIALERAEPLQGPQGDPGPQGPQGPAGTVAGTIIVSNAVSGVGYGGTKIVSDVSCPPEKILLSGGVQVVTDIGPSRAFISDNYPLNASTWRGAASAVDAGAGPMTVTTYAVCSQ